MTDHQPVAAAQPLSPADEKLWSTLAHIGNILGLLPSLLIFLLLGPRSRRVRDESREALNFVITVAIAVAVLFVVGLVLGGLAGAAPNGLALVLALLGFLVGLVQFALWVVLVVFSIVAATRVNAGGSYRYPLSLHLVK